jgi:hypothetical protein
MTAILFLVGVESNLCANGLHASADTLTILTAGSLMSAIHRR